MAIASVLSEIGDAYREGIVDAGKQPELFLLVSFLVTFGFIRTSAHMIRAQVSWWPGNVQTKSGTHIHHLVWGICTLLVAGYLGLGVAPDSPWRELLAVLFGVGMGLTLDEFALWLHLEDVYWSEKGRQSIDAVIAAAVFGLILLLGLRMFLDLAETAAREVQAIVTAAGAVGIALALLNAAKQKYLFVLLSFVVPPVGLVGAVRLAKPGSIWARFVYGEGRLARARARFGES